MLVGLTGGIGSGKSTAKKIFAELGAHVLCADQLSREVMGANSDCTRKIIAHFGGHFCRPDGKLDRAALAEIVFNDPAQLAVLEAITHPAIRRLQEHKVAQIRQQDPEALIIYDVALLFERGIHRSLAYSIVIEAHTKLRLERLHSARGMQSHDAEKRMQNQYSDEKRRQLCDFLIENNGSKADLHRKCTAVYTELCALQHKIHPETAG